ESPKADYAQFSHAIIRAKGRACLRLTFDRQRKRDACATFTCAGDSAIRAQRGGGGRNARSYRRRISSVLGRSLLARAALRENALRPGPARRRLSRRVPDHKRSGI